MKLRKKVTSTLQKLIGHHAMETLRYHYYKLFVPNLGYSKKYYEGIQHANQIYYGLFAKVICGEFKPKTVVDCGCGHGGISAEFLKNGVSEAFLFDGSPDAVEIARSTGFKNVEVLDFTRAAEIPASGDIAICLEVAEHVPAKFAENLVRLISNVAPVLIFTAAPPGVGGHLHVNTKPQSYWIGMFLKYRMKFDKNAVERVRKAFDGRMLSDYDDNLMIFRKE